MTDRIWTDTNNMTMKNRELPMFPLSESTQDYDHQGKPRFTQRNIGGHTKFESTVNAVAQGYAQNTQQFTNTDEAADYIIELSVKIHNRLEASINE
jgi:hypothetical protein